MLGVLCVLGAGNCCVQCAHCHVCEAATLKSAAMHAVSPTLTVEVAVYWRLGVWVLPAVVLWLVTAVAGGSNTGFALCQILSERTTQ